MLLIARDLGSLVLGKLALIYEDSQVAVLQNNNPGLSWSEASLQAESDLYYYLRDVFFRQDRALYAIWTIGKIYAGALRLEPYDQGLLLTGLETRPDYRNQGIATNLIRAVQQMLPLGQIVFSHVSKDNIASLNVHKACGFQIYLSYAAFLNGSVSDDGYTLRWVKK